MYILFNKTTSAGLPSLYCKVNGQPEDSVKCIRLFVIASHGVVVCNYNLKYITNSVNLPYLFKWLEDNKTPPLNKLTTKHQRKYIERVLNLLK